MQIKSQGELITEIAKRKRFLKSDVKLILDGLIEVLEDLIQESEPFKDNEKTKLLLKVRGFGNLYLQSIPERKGRSGEILPMTTRPTFRLAENIRYANKKYIKGVYENDDEFE